MKYVTLEHKLAATYYPHINFDTNDTSFETEIYELRHQRYLEQERIKNQIKDEIDQVMDTERQTKKELLHKTYQNVYFMNLFNIF